jgi:hypothetical protein
LNNCCFPSPFRPAGHGPLSQSMFSSANPPCRGFASISLGNGLLRLAGPLSSNKISHDPIRAFSSESPPHSLTNGMSACAGAARLRGSEIHKLCCLFAVVFRRFDGTAGGRLGAGGGGARPRRCASPAQEQVGRRGGAGDGRAAAGPSSSLPFSLPPYFSLSSVFVAARAPRAPLSLPSSRVGGAMCGVLRWCVVRGAALWARRNSGATTDPEKPARKQV